MYLHNTVISNTFVATGFTPFSALHSYLPSQCLDMLCRIRTSPVNATSPYTE